MAGINVPGSNLSPDTKQIQRMIELWDNIPVALQWLIFLEFRYWYMKPNWVALSFGVVLLLVGVISFAFEITPIASLILILVGILLGVVAVWEIQRPR